VRLAWPLALLLVLAAPIVLGAYLLSFGEIASLTLLPSELQWLGRSLSWCASFLANVFFTKTGGYFDRAVELNPLLHLWSLGVEEQFYLVWPVLLIALGAEILFGRGSPLVALAFGAGLTVVVGIAAAPKDQGGEGVTVATLAR